MKLFLALMLAGFAVQGFSQNIVRLVPDSAVIVDGVELGFRINEEEIKVVGDEEFTRYKISFYVHNDGCAMYYRYRANGSSNYNEVATFRVRNANGKRLTAKEAKVLAKEWWLPVRVKEKNYEGKDIDVARQMMAGYMFAPGDHIEQSIIIYVPKFELPVVEVYLGRSDYL